MAALSALIIGVLSATVSGARTRRSRSQALKVNSSSCDLADSQKQECGFFGIDAGGCTSRGCCWRESQANGVPWCFDAGSSPSPSPPSGQCSVPDSSKVDCGFSGIDQSGCVTRGCCWASSSTAGVPWCFNQGGSGPSPTPPSPTPPSPTPPSPTPPGGNWSDSVNPQGSSMTFVHLFEWSWEDIAKECEDWLGPKGYTAVQVSPPQEHMSGSAWWTRYQPVSYNIISRSGDEAGFRSMVSRCRAVGVGIYADGVINHMAAGGGTGVGGTQYSARNFPGTFSPDDFHHDSGNKLRNCGVTNYANKQNVQYCDLVGLADLCTSCSYVQDRIAGYINYLKNLGIAGFRVDAAKHIDSGELATIMGKIEGGLYSFFEVIGHSGEAVTPEMYYHLSDITEFNYAIKVANNFQEEGRLQYLDNFGESWGLMPSDLGVIFIDNHDTQRGHAGEAALTHMSGDLYNLANIFMLAHPYGYPKVMSSYYFSDTDAGPPGQGVHQNGLNCFYGKPWVCEHRWPEIANMVAWRRSAGAGWPQNWETQGGNRISFCRNGAACVLINREGTNWQASVSVSMPDGQYCNVQISDGSDCPKVNVQGGRVSVNVPGMKAVAFHVGKQ